MDTILQELQRASKAAGQETAWLRAHPAAAGEDWLPHIRRYVLCRFLLEEDEPASDLLLLARKSVTRVTGIPLEQLSVRDRPSGCTAANSVLDKKVLLLMSLADAMEVKLIPEEVPAIRTLEDLTLTLHSRVQEKIKEPP
jgi:hypothetical protein